jgi:hypothetical protein
MHSSVYFQVEALDRNFLYFDDTESKLFAGNESLKNVILKADQAVRVGDSLQLKCDYDLENAVLYSIRWYFGAEEFYRFVPKESPPTRVFPMDGVSVDVSITYMYQYDTRQLCTT